MLQRDWFWTHPEGKKPTPKETDAIIYLIEEWDFDGYEQFPNGRTGASND